MFRFENSIQKFLGYSAQDDDIDVVPGFIFGRGFGSRCIFGGFNVIKNFVGASVDTE